MSSSYRNPFSRFHARTPNASAHKPSASLSVSAPAMIANSIALAGEAVERLRSLYTNLESQIQPGDEYELCLVQTIAACRWRQMRLWSIEKALLGGEIVLNDSLAAPDAPPIDTGCKTAHAYHSLGGRSRALDIIHRQENALTRAITGSMKSLLHYRNAPQNKEFSTSFRTGVVLV